MRGYLIVTGKRFPIVSELHYLCVSRQSIKSVCYLLTWHFIITLAVLRDIIIIMKLYRNLLHSFLIFVFLTCVWCRKRDRSKGRVRLSGKCKPQILAEYELTFVGGWSMTLYPKMYPRYRPPAQWSKLVGKLFSVALLYYLCHQNIYNAK